MRGNADENLCQAPVAAGTFYLHVCQHHVASQPGCRWAQGSMYTSQCGVSIAERIKTHRVLGVKPISNPTVSSCRMDEGLRQCMLIELSPHLGELSYIYVSKGK
jgi:hypothetical protein